MPKIKNKIRILPIFIFAAVLSLSVKINTVYDLYRQKENKSLSISTSQAQAEEKMDKDTKQLTEMLDKNDNETQANTTKSGSFSSSEILILQDLAERREALDVRAKEIDKRAIQLKVAEGEIDKKIKQLQEYEQRLSKLINQYSQKEQENIDALTKLYTSMKPKDAARIFDTMDLEISVAILKGMKPSSSSAIISQMTAQQAQAITAKLIGNNF